MLIERAGTAQRRGHTLGIVLAIVASVLVVGGGITAWLLLSRPDDTPQPSTPSAAAPAASPKSADAPAAEPAPAPDEKELAAKAEAVRRQALAEREAAEAAVRAAGKEPQATAGSQAPKSDGGLTSGVFSRLGLSGAKAEEPKPAEPKPDPKPDETKTDETKTDDAGGKSVLDIFGRKQGE